MAVILTIANAHELVVAYRVLILEIKIYDSTPVQVGTTEYLTMGKGDVEIEFEQTTGPTYTVKIINGFYITHKDGWTASAEDPSIYAQVLQRSAP